jgi:hypothetical protein
VFPTRWPRAKRGFIPELQAYHLESEDAPMAVNWKGRRRAVEWNRLYCGIKPSLWVQFRQACIKRHRTPSPMETIVNVQIPEVFKGLFEPHRYRVYYGGRGGGKSWAICPEPYHSSRVNAPLRILCAREVQNSIKDSVHKLL